MPKPACPPIQTGLKHALEQGNSTSVRCVCLRDDQREYCRTVLSLETTDWWKHCETIHGQELQRLEELACRAAVLRPLPKSYGCPLPSCKSHRKQLDDLASHILEEHLQQLQAGTLLERTLYPELIDVTAEDGVKLLTSVLEAAADAVKLREQHAAPASGQLKCLTCGTCVSSGTLLKHIIAAHVSLTQEAGSAAASASAGAEPAAGQQEQQEAKRGPGRPRKQPADSGQQQEEEEQQQQQQEQVRRGPGRPRKQGAEAAEHGPQQVEQQEEQQGQQQEKRGPGRPRKQPLPDAAAPAVQQQPQPAGKPAKPGRPRKPQPGQQGQAQGEAQQEDSEDEQGGYANPRVPPRVMALSLAPYEQQEEEAWEEGDSDEGGPAGEQAAVLDPDGSDAQSAAEDLAGSSGKHADAADKLQQQQQLQQEQDAKAASGVGLLDQPMSYPPSQWLLPARGTTRIATWNLENFTWKTVTHQQHWPKVCLVADTILASGASLVALQEVQGGRACLEALAFMLRVKSSAMKRPGHWNWHLSGNLYASPEHAPTKGGVPEYSAFFWEESQQVRPWLLQDDGRASFKPLKYGSNPLCFVRAPYYGLFSVRSHPVLLVSCHLLSNGDTSQEVRRLPLLLDAAEHSNKGLLGHAAAMVLGDFNLGHNSSWASLEAVGYRGVLGRSTATTTTSNTHFDNIYCMQQDAAAGLQGPPLVATPVPGAAAGAELGVVMPLPPSVAAELAALRNRGVTTRLSGQLNYPNHMLVFADFAGSKGGKAGAAAGVLKQFTQPDIGPVLPRK